MEEEKETKEARELAEKLVEEVLKSRGKTKTLTNEDGDEEKIHCHKPALASAAAATDDLKSGTGRPVE